MPVDDYDPQDNDRTRQLVEDQLADNDSAEWGEDDRRRLETQLRAIRWPLFFALPRGFSIDADGVRMFWDSLSGRLLSGRLGGQLTLRLPLLPLKDALEFGHAGDLSIPMFTEIHLDDTTPARKGDILFMLLILRDYGYVRGAYKTMIWAFWAWKIIRDSKKPLPLPE